MKVPLRKVLLYGGCHALVLRDLLAAYFGDAVEATLLVNFDLIGSGQPFPYERLSQFDVVLYSPIENKGEYNTNHLVEACRAKRVEAFCYPWLEWHGYCPGATKSTFKNRFQWHYGGLVDAAASFDSFERFLEWAIDAYPDNATIDETFRRSHAMLLAAEQKHDMPIRVADFISDHYRYDRLFLISDHPSLKIYIHVLRQILSLIGIADGGACERMARREAEPQRRWRTPIFPRVATRLDLRFSDTKWIDEDIVPERSIDLRSYLLLHYHGDSIIMGPKTSASISPVAGFGTNHDVMATTRIVADHIGNVPGDRGDEYRLLDVLSAEALPLARNQHFRIDADQWRSTWG